MTSKAQHPLKLERQRHNLSQKMLADFAQLGLSTIARAERGEQIGAEARQRLCDYLRKTSQELGLVKEESNSEEVANKSVIPIDDGDHDMNRRQAIKQLGMAGISTVLGANTIFSSDSWEQLSSVFRKTPLIHETTLSNLQSITRNYWQLRTSIAPQDIASSVLAHLKTITQTLHQSLPEQSRQRLCSIAGETAQLLGQMAFDMNDLRAAQSYYQVSIEAAREAGDDNLCAATFGRTSLLSTSKSDPESSIRLLQKGQSLAERSNNHLSRAWLLAIEAEKWAQLNQPQKCVVVLDEAGQEIANATRANAINDDPYWTEFTSARLYAYKGACFIQLGQANDAIQSLTDALSIASTHSLRPRAIILTDLAKAYILGNDIEMACHVASDALQLADDSKSPMIFGRIQEVHKQLHPWNSVAAVQALDGQLLYHLAGQALIA